MTVAEHLDAAFDRIDSYTPADGKAAREFALAKTAIEDARMRFTRGLAMNRGVFAPVDLEKSSCTEARRSWVETVEAQESGA